MAKANTINFNYIHPELKEGEMFLTNQQTSSLYKQPQFESSPFRIGKTAYDESGNKLEGFKPVFKLKEQPAV